MPTNTCPTCGAAVRPVRLQPRPFTIILDAAPSPEGDIWLLSGGQACRLEGRLLDDMRESKGLLYLEHECPTGEYPAKDSTDGSRD